MCAAPRLTDPISSRHTDYRSRAGRRWTRDGGAEEANLLANRWLSDRTHSHQPASLPATQQRSRLGEGARAEARMIVIEYEMSISWNERAIRARRSSREWFSHHWLTPAVCEALVYRRHPAAVSLGKHICDTQGVNVMNVHPASGLKPLSSLSLFLVFSVSYQSWAFFILLSQSQK